MRARRTGTALIVAAAVPAAVFGTTPARPPETVPFILEAQNLAALAADFSHP